LWRDALVVDRRGHLMTGPRQVWHVVHVAATVAIPWVLAAYYFRSQTRTITAEADLVADFHTVAAIAASVLLSSAVLLRLRGRSTAATVPFAVLWATALAYSLFQIGEYGDNFHCEAELCMPGFELFFTVIPFAFVVTFAVCGSAAISVATRRADASAQD
jgi:hypothetical protein